MPPSGDARLQRLRDVERSKSMRKRRTIHMHVVHACMHVSLFIVGLRVVRCKERVRNLFHKRNAQNKEREKNTSTIRGRRTVWAWSLLIMPGGKVKKRGKKQEGKKQSGKTAKNGGKKPIYTL